MSQKLKVSINRIKCLRTTAEIDADEIYYALYFFSGKAGKKNEPLVSTKAIDVRVSDIMDNVVRSLAWRPNPNEQVFELGDADAFGFLFVLVEKDDATMYNNLKSGNVAAEFEKLDILDFIKNTKRPKGWSDWVPIIVKALVTIFKKVKADDMIDAEPFGYALDDPRLMLNEVHTIRLKNGFATYEVDLQFALVSE
jgi:hypothetical protein